MYDLAAELDLGDGGAAHVGERRLVAMISGDIDSTSSGFARSLANSSGFWLRNQRPPLIELRVVSLPPTMSRMTFRGVRARSDSRAHARRACGSEARRPLTLYRYLPSRRADIGKA